MVHKLRREYYNNLHYNRCCVYFKNSYVSPVVRKISWTTLFPGARMVFIFNYQMNKGFISVENYPHVQGF